MLSLPLEIIKQILADLSESSLLYTPESKAAEHRDIGIGSEQQYTHIARYATISKEWQSLIEAHTFKKLRITSQELDHLDDIVRKRQHLVEEIHYEVILPKYSVEECSRRETKDEQDVNSRVFTQAIISIFDVLKDWRAKDFQRYSMPDRMLSIGCHSPSDGPWRNAAILEEVMSSCNDIGPYRYLHSMIEFITDHARQLPDIVAVTTITTAVHSRSLDPASFCFLACSMPQLRHFCPHLSDLDTNDEQRMIRRLAFAEGLVKLPPSVKHFSVRYYYETPDDENLEPSCTHGNMPDPLSCSIRVMSQGLVKLFLGDCVISTDIFWPSMDSESKTSVPAWPNLEEFRIQSRSILANGSWLFEKDPDYPSSDSGNETEEDDVESDDEEPEQWWRSQKTVSFRRKPIWPLFDDFYVHAAHAAGAMPKLKTMRISFTNTIRDGPDHGFTFTDVHDIRKAAWDVWPLYEPSTNVIDAWKTAKGAGLDTQVSLTCTSWPTDR